MASGFERRAAAVALTVGVMLSPAVTAACAGFGGDPVTTVGATTTIDRTCSAPVVVLRFAAPSDLPVDVRPSTRLDGERWWGPLPPGDAPAAWDQRSGRLLVVHRQATGSELDVGEFDGDDGRVIAVGLGPEVCGAG